MNWKRIVIILVIVVIVIGGLGLLASNLPIPRPGDAMQGANGETTVLQNDPLPSLGVVGAEGQIVPRRDAQLSFQTGGEIIEIIAEKGKQLNSSDPIMRLDAAEQETALAKAQAALEIAVANKQVAEVGVQAAEVAEEAAAVGLQASEVTLALVKVEPAEAEIALNESAIALAQAGVGQASASQSVVLQGAPASQIQTAEAQLRAAEAQLLPVRDELDRLMREESNDEDAVARAQYNYNAAVANVNAAQAALDEVRSGASSGQRQSAYGNVSASVAQKEAAEAELDNLLAGPRAERITVAETGVAQAETAVAEAALAVEKAQSALTQADAGILQAEAAVESAQDAVEQMMLTAPFDGLVADIDVRLGEVVGAGMPAVTYADFDGWQVKTTDLSELDVVQLQPGAPVEIQVDAIPGKTLNGMVESISNISRDNRGDVTYEVTIALDDYEELPLRWGMTVFVDVDVDVE